MGPLRASGFAAAMSSDSTGVACTWSSNGTTSAKPGKACVGGRAPADMGYRGGHRSPETSCCGIPRILSQIDGTDLYVEILGRSGLVGSAHRRGL